MTDTKTKNLNHLNKLLKHSFPKKKKAKNLFLVFALLASSSLVGVFISSFLLFEEHWKDILLSICSGVFASGLFAAAIEWINIRNKKTFNSLKLSELKFYCINLIDFISDDLYDIEEEHTYFEWVDLLLIKYNDNKNVLFGLLDRLDDIVKSASYFLCKEYDEFNNSFPSDETLFLILRITIICKSIKKAVSSSKNTEKEINRYLKDTLPSIICDLFPDLKKSFTKRTSHEKN